MSQQNYENPPLIEMLLGLHFFPVDGLVPGVHLGRIIDKMTRRFSDAARFSQLNAVGQRSEYLGPAAYREVIEKLEQSRIAERAGDFRIRAADPRTGRMVQLEDGWLVLNWNRYAATGGYPRFSRLLPQFKEFSDDLHRSLEELKLPPPRPKMWEIAYVNHIDRGKLWSDPTDFHKVFPGLFGRFSTKAALLESQEYASTLLLREISARVRISVKVVGRPSSDPGKPGETLSLQLVCRGDVSDPSEVEPNIRTGHEALIALFDQLSSDEAKRHWMRA